MDPDHARELLTAELAELDERARFAAESRSDTVATQRRTVQEALERLENGSYGRCAVCDAVIDDERLEARPEALTCREHADTPVGA